MEIQVKCVLEKRHYEGIKKWAKLVEKEGSKEKYKLLNVTAIIEAEREALFIMQVKSEKEMAKGRAKMLGLMEKFGIKPC